MNAEQLSKVGSDLVRRCGTRDPFQIANALGINVMDDCENLGSLKGMYCIVKRNRFIFLNKDLSPQMKRIVCAHEIGHDRLHRALAKKMACGVPFGIGKMFTLIPIGFGISGTVGVVALNLVLGGLIGGVILIWKLAVALWYLPLTIYRLVT